VELPVPFERGLLVGATRGHMHVARERNAERRGGAAACRTRRLKQRDPLRDERGELVEDEVIAALRRCERCSERSSSTCVRRSGRMRPGALRFFLPRAGTTTSVSPGHRGLEPPCMCFGQMRCEGGLSIGPRIRTTSTDSKRAQ
jgi:hypothetical protein